MDSLVFMTEDQVRDLRRRFGTPVYVYDERTLVQRAAEVTAFPNAFGLTARFAMKALPTAAIVRLFHSLGLHIDASSGFEAERALRAGIPPHHIQLTAQEMPRNVKTLIDQGVLFNACSLYQLESYGRLFPGTETSVRINPGLGSGATNRTNVGGPAASFGIWHEHFDEILDVARRHNLRITRMHTHIGSGSHPEVWVHCARLSLSIAARLDEVTTLSLGGGYKVARMSTETGADLQEIGHRILPEFEAFAEQHGRRLHLEVEPGTYLVANAGAIVSSVIDVTDTGTGGYNFIKIDSGMTDNVRPSMYGAEHPLVVVPQTPGPREARKYIVCGHCCESGDILTPERGNPEGLEPREMAEARTGDLLVIEASGAYCASMSCKNYNSFPESAEVLLTASGFRLIRKKQTLDQIVLNEVDDL